MKSQSIIYKKKFVLAHGNHTERSQAMKFKFYRQEEAQKLFFLFYV